MSASSTPASGLVRMNAPVFYFAATFILLFGITVIAIPQQAGAWLLAAQNWAANTVGWYYMLAMTLYLVFVVNSVTCAGPACCLPPGSASRCSSSASPSR
jgi:choline/glycine/proline betaine transport protein